MCGVMFGNRHLIGATCGLLWCIIDNTQLYNDLLQGCHELVNKNLAEKKQKS